MSLQDIRCIKMCDDHHLAIYTCDPDTSISPITLQTSSEAELGDWVSQELCESFKFFKY